MIARDRERPLAELLPWLLPLNQAVVLSKEGGLLAAFELEGLDQDAADELDRDRAARSLEEGLKGLDGRYTVWSTYHRYRSETRSSRAFAHPITQAIHDAYVSHLRTRGIYRHQHVLSILYLPEREDHVLKDLLSLCRSGRWLSAIQKLGALLGHTSHLDDGLQHLSTELREFEAVMNSFAGAIQSIKARRLLGEEFTGFLNRCASSGAGLGGVRKTSQQVPMDSLLGEAEIHVGADHLDIRAVSGHKKIGVLGIKAWPDSTYPGLIQTIFCMPFELSLTQTFQPVDRATAKAHIQSIQRFHLNLERSMFSLLRESLTGEATQVNDGTRQVSAAEAREALLSLAEERQLYGYYNLSLFVSATHLQELNQRLNQAAAVMRDAGFHVIREGMHLLSAWAGCLPGQWGQLVRWHFIHAGNVADLYPQTAPSLGRSKNVHFERQLNLDCSSLVQLPGKDSTVYDFNFYQEDLGHTMVLGPSRSGKSMLVHFLLSQSFQYPNARVIVFDKDRSARIATLTQGGTVLELQDPGSVSCNPLQYLHEEGESLWLQSWLRALITQYGYGWQAEDDAYLTAGLAAVLELKPSERRLTTLSLFLPQHLSQALQPWLLDSGGCPLFDGEHDCFHLERFLSIDMGDILREEGIARLFMRYAFHRLDRLLAQATPGPTTIYIEEAWFMLSNAQFAEQIRDWLKTLPKKLANVVLSTQSLEDLERSGIFGAIADNIPTRIFLANPHAQAQRTLYIDQFGLNESQLLRITQAEPKRQFLICTPSESRLVDCPLPKAVVNVLRSDLKAQRLFDESRRQHPENWMHAYLEALDHAS